MKIVNDKTCAWINDLEIRKSYKILSEDQQCEWLVVGAGYTGLSAAKKLAELHPTQNLILVAAH